MKKLILLVILALGASLTAGEHAAKGTYTIDEAASKKVLLATGKFKAEQIDQIIKSMKSVTTTITDKELIMKMGKREQKKAFTVKSESAEKVELNITLRGKEKTMSINFVEGGITITGGTNDPSSMVIWKKS